jgi:hypothetical protein
MDRAKLLYEERIEAEYRQRKSAEVEVCYDGEHFRIITEQWDTALPDNLLQKLPPSQHEARDLVEW